MSKNNKQKNISTNSIETNNTKKVQSKIDASSEASKPGKRLPIILSFVLGLLAFILYSNTFEHRFVLDDHGIIKNNKMTKAPLSWENTKLIFSTPLRKGDFSDLENTLYRPAVKFLFNIEWNLFKGNEDVNLAAHKFHVVNVLFYAMLCGILFMVLYEAFHKRWLIPFFTTLFFVVHPMHVEVVANVKSGDEILSLLGIILSLRLIQLYLNKEKTMYLILAILSFLIASFSKESTVVAVALIPLFIYFFTKASIQKNAIISGIMLACTLFFLLCRHNSLKGYPESSKTSPLDNYMVLCDPAERTALSPDLQEKYKNSSQFASAVSTLGYYAKVFLIPYPLSCDYSYASLEPIRLNDLRFIISFLLFLGLFAFAIYRWKHKDPISFGILWFFVAMSITSNVFFLIGTSFGERLFFIPSLGLSLAFVAGLAHFLNKHNKEENAFLKTIFNTPILSGIILLIVGLYSYKTYDRNKDWSTDYNLFAKDIKNFPKSTHLLFYMGNHLSGSERKESLTNQLANLGLNQNQINDSTAKENLQAIQYFNDALSFYPALPSDGYNQLGKAYYNIGQIDSAHKYYLKALHEDSTNAIFINNVGTVYYIKNQVMEAFPYFIKANQRDSTESDFANNIGCIYGATNRFDSAIYWFDKASKLDPLDITSLGFLEVTYRNLGNVQQADYYKSRLATVKIERQNSNQ